ncbi:Transposase DDE domain [Rubrobacter radiotolerans]|uniref:Transposase n=1 Tax=Rubrobacter radiotolerans TaxID=42256 RepID=A0A023WZF4_RUBRA|nr:transposase [Rubrobacter radiotolerans]AHY45468.1 Transposase DDE domain [Rubrobacter radiotolerans]MDX5892879.1 transposase [Rubrobacter radiotolerans]SMC02669.1 transposase, IS4 family [Rubrobacter radiotolerans DSM 5868]
MAQVQHTPTLTSLEEALTALFCLIDDAYRLINPRGQGRYESLKKLSDSEVLTLALFQQLRGIESERSFLRDAARFFSHLFPGVVGLHPSSFHRRVRKLRCFLESLRRTLVGELVGEPETLIVDSTLLSVLHPRQVRQSAGWAASSSGAAWARWGTFSVYGVKLHLLCTTNRVPISYELTAANTADVLLVRELLAGAELEEDEVARRLLGDLAYRSEPLREELAEAGVLLATEKAERRSTLRQQAEVCFAVLKGVFGLDRTLATTLMGLATRIAAKVAAYTYGLYVNRLLGRPQGCIKELWA